MPVLMIKNGAHHLDEFLPRDDDDVSGTNVREIRQKIMLYLEKWLNIN